LSGTIICQKEAMEHYFFVAAETEAMAHYFFVAAETA
jgi:hypothetical protein